MNIISVKTRKVIPPKDEIYDILDEISTNLSEKDIILITSKIVAIHEGRCVKKYDVDKDKLIKKEAYKFIPREEVPGGHAILTIKENALLASSGIDESNSGEYFTLLPKNPIKSAKFIWEYLRNKADILDLGVIITDSHTQPLRYGTVGISVGSFGLEIFRDYRHTKDIFGREIKISRVNIVDSLASIGVLSMGEGSEQTPISIIRGLDDIVFSDNENYPKLKIPLEEDIYYPILKEFNKSK